MCGVGLICLWLAGPSGPCGPGTLLGTLFFVAGYPVAVIGWVLCFVSVITLLRNPRTRSGLTIPAFAATPLAAGLTILFTRPDELLRHAWQLLVAVWPPLVAVFFVARGWLLRRQQSGIYDAEVARVRLLVWNALKRERRKLANVPPRDFCLLPGAGIGLLRSRQFLR